MELVGVPNPGLVLDGKSPCSILVSVGVVYFPCLITLYLPPKGLDTAEPVLQLGNYVFKGKYEGMFDIMF